jgi:hypothetical protein
LGIFKRKSLAADLDQLNTRKSLLVGQLEIAERKLAEATAARAAHLLEGDLDVPNEQSPLIQRLHDEKDAIVIAISTIGERIAESESKFAAERDLALRSAAAKELAVKADTLDRVTNEVAAAIAKMPAVLDDVLNRMPLPHLILKANVESFAASVVEALRAEVGEARRYITRLVEGDAALVTPRTEAEANPAPAPAIERQTVFLLGRSKWAENGEIITSGPHCSVSPPIEIARLALRHGHAIATGSDLAVTLQMRQPPSYANYAPADCLDISQPKPVTKPVGTPTAAAPVFHSEFTPARGGFASVSRNSR